MARAGNPEDEPSYEEIGGGLIEDTPPRGLAALPVPGRAPGPAGGQGWDDDGGRPPKGDLLGVVRSALAGAWAECSAAFRAPGFWLAIAVGLAMPAAAAALLTSWGTANEWFEAKPLLGQDGALVGLLVIAAALTVLAAAVLGTVWGFSRARTPAGSATTIRILVSGAKGVVFAAAGALAILLAGLPAGGTPGLAAVTAVVVITESLVFGAVGAASRACFRSPLPGGLLAGIIVALLCGANVVAAGLLMPSTFVVEKASVPVNVTRDSDGRLTSYECVGEPARYQMVLHTERVAWLAASNPLLVFGAMAAGTVPKDNDVGWLLTTLQWGFEGAARDVACINGVASEELQPAPPIWLFGLAWQAAAAALVLVPARIVARRREASPA